MIHVAAAFLLALALVLWIPAYFIAGILGALYDVLRRRRE
jgi:hypothetical protein